MHNVVSRAGELTLQQVMWTFHHRRSGRCRRRPAVAARAALSATSALASGAMAGTLIAKVEPLPGVLDGDVAAQHAAEVPGDG